MPSIFESEGVMSLTVFYSFLAHQDGAPEPCTRPAGHNSKVKDLFCFKLDAMSVPEALATTIRILLMFSIVLAHRRGTVARAPQPARERLTTPGHLWPSLPTPDVVS